MEGGYMKIILTDVFMNSGIGLLNHHTTFSTEKTYNKFIETIKQYPVLFFNCEVEI